MPLAVSKAFELITKNGNVNITFCSNSLVSK